MIPINECKTIVRNEILVGIMLELLKDLDEAGILDIYLNTDNEFDN